MLKVGKSIGFIATCLSFVMFNSVEAAVACPLSSFPSAGIDTTPSLGQFYLRLTEAAGNALGIADCPSASDCLIESPVLSDKLTQIGRSDPINEPDPPGEDGVDVCINTDCSDFFLVKDSDFEWPPADSGFLEGPAGIKEVHTKIVNLKMTGGGYSVELNPDHPSIGEVESKSGDGFPAESFFNVFVKIEIPLLGEPLHLYNKDPLIIVNNNLECFPPEVVYIHKSSTAIPVFAAPPCPSFFPDCSEQKIGKIVLAGHGLGPNFNKETFVEAVINAAAAAGIPINPVSGIPELPLQITLNSLTAVANNGAISITWTTGTEENNAGSRIWRGQPISGTCSNNSNDYTNVRQVTPLVASRGTATTGATYTYTDEDVQPGTTYCYAVEDIDYDGTSTYHMDQVASVKVN